MGLWSTDAVMDSGLNFLKGDVQKIVICTSQPANYADAKQASTNTLATSSDKAAALASTDFAIAASTRAAGGRKITTLSCSGMTVFRAGTATHVAMINDTSSSLLQVTICTNRAMTTDDTVTIPAYRVEIADPATDSEI